MLTAFQGRFYARVLMAVKVLNDGSRVLRVLKLKNQTGFLSVRLRLVNQTVVTRVMSEAEYQRMNPRLVFKEMLECETGQNENPTSMAST